MERQYSWVGPTGHEELDVNFTDTKLERLSEFLVIEIRPYTKELILTGLKKVLNEEMDNYEFSGNLLNFECDGNQVTIYHLIDEDLASSTISTKQFYDLVEEYADFQILAQQGLLKLPIEIDD